MTIGEEDWVLLNGYADGELDAADAAILRRRLGQEPALAEELARIQALKRGLATLRPAAGQPAAATSTPSPSSPLAPPVPARTRSPLWSLAAAVTLLVAVGFSAFALLSPAPQPLQQALLETAGEAPTPPAAESTPKEVASLEAGTARGARLGEIAAPDLTASNLTLTEMALRRDGEAESVTMHYLGPNGCRVTLVARSPEPAAAPSEPAPLSAEWQTARARYSLTAEGMDPARFQAIASYAEAQVRHSDEQEMLRVALKDTTAKSHPCA